MYEPVLLQLSGVKTLCTVSKPPYSMEYSPFGCSTVKKYAFAPSGTLSGFLQLFLPVSTMLSPDIDELMNISVALLQDMILIATNSNNVFTFNFPFLIVMGIAPGFVVITLQGTLRQGIPLRPRN